MSNSHADASHVIQRVVACFRTSLGRDEHVASNRHQSSTFWNCIMYSPVSGVNSVQMPRAWVTGASPAARSGSQRCWAGSVLMGVRQLGFPLCPVPTLVRGHPPRRAAGCDVPTPGSANTAHVNYAGRRCPIVASPTLRSARFGLISANHQLISATGIISLTSLFRQLYRYEENQTGRYGSTKKRHQNEEVRICHHRRQ